MTCNIHIKSGVENPSPLPDSLAPEKGRAFDIHQSLIHGSQPQAMVEGNRLAAQKPNPRGWPGCAAGPGKVREE